MDKFGKVLIIGLIFTIGSVFFFFSFTSFTTSATANDVVSGEQIFITTNQTAADKFVNDLIAIEKTTNEQNPSAVPVSKSFGIGLFVDFKDSNGVVIPQTSNFLVVNQLNSLLAGDGVFLDFAKFQFDVLAILTQDNYVDATVDYQVLSNGVKFLEGKAYGKGMTKDGKLNLTFEQGKKIGDVLELDFEKGEVPYVDKTTNTMEIRIIHVDAIIGQSFDTVHRVWSGEFPALIVKFDADSSTRVIRDYRGIAVETLPNDVAIQVCGHDQGRLITGGGFGSYAPTIVVKQGNNEIVKSIAPVWGSRDADFNSNKCGIIVGGLDRNADYDFIVDGKLIKVKTPSTPFTYRAECKMDTNIAGTSEVRKCTSNFGWSN